MLRTGATGASRCSTRMTATPFWDGRCDQEGDGEAARGIFRALLETPTSTWSSSPDLSAFELKGKQGLMTVYRNGNYGHRNNVLFKERKDRAVQQGEPDPGDGAHRLRGEHAHQEGIGGFPFRSAFRPGEGIHASHRKEGDGRLRGHTALLRSRILPGHKRHGGIPPLKGKKVMT